MSQLIEKTAPPPIMPVTIYMDEASPTTTSTPEVEETDPRTRARQEKMEQEEEMKMIHSFLSTRSQMHEFQLGRRLGSGTFGVVFEAWKVDERDDDPVPIAIKFQFIDNEFHGTSLETEYNVYKILNKPLSSSKPDSFYSGIPKYCYYSSDHKNLRMLAMPLFGSDLSKVLGSTNDGCFSQQTAGLLAIQMIDHLQFVHSRGIVHRDIKPGNMVIGGHLGMDRLAVQLVDFGLSKSYLDPETGKHIKRVRSKGIVGTLRYLGIDANRGCGPSRRDDLQALAYVLIYMVKGDLPWSSIIKRSRRLQGKGKGKKKDLPKVREQDRARNKEVAKAKMNTPSSVLCEGLAPEFEMFLDETHSLGYKQRPNYQKLRALWTGMLTRQFGGVFFTAADWIHRKDAS